MVGRLLVLRFLPVRLGRPSGDPVITRLRYHLLNRPEPQGQVAEACGIGGPLLSRYCTGVQSIPPRHLAALAACLDVPAACLVGYVDLDEIPG